MSSAAEAWAWKQDLPPREKFILVCLCDYYNDDQRRAWMKQGSIAKKTGYSRQTVNAALQSLEKTYGLIESETRYYDDGRRAANIYRVSFSTHVKDVDMEVSHVNTVDTVHVKDIDTVHVKTVDSKNSQHRTHNIEREGSAPETERTVSPPDFSLPLDAQVEVALRYPESPEAQALLAANGISTDQRPLWDLKRFLKQTLGDQADHPQVVGNLTAWAAAEHSLQEIRAAWLRAVERRKREGRGLRAVHHFVDILNGTYQPDSHELAAENAAAVAQAEQAAAAAPKPGDRVQLADGSVHTVHDFDESGGWVIFADGAGHCRVTDCVVVH